ncbi:MAG: hypothetical protein MUC46_06050 [Desulfobacterales bacterium]|jgi:hypothetical protein|nr:hypothetical protein [Desulfobacterales bacterium]
MEASVKEQLMGIHNQLSSLMADPRLKEVLVGPRPGPVHPAGGVCLLVDDVRSREDFLIALNKIHQWIGYVIEVIESNP